MGGHRIVMPHFSPADAEVMAELMEGDRAWIHEDSAARAHEEQGVPDEYITPRDYLLLRRDRPARTL